MKLAVRMLVMLLIVGVVLGGVFFFDAFKAKMIHKYMAMFANPSQSVATMVAASQPWQKAVVATGSLRARNGADLSADTAGIVDQINFNSGDDVAAGTVLVRLRTEDDAAHLQQLQTAVGLARTNYQRDLQQLRAQAVARSTVDTDLSTLQSAQAAMAQQQAVIDKKTVVAPFAGHLGIRQVDVGQYVGAGTAIVSLQALDPIYVDFYVPQQDLGAMKVGQGVGLSVDTYPGRVFAGTIESVNAALDIATRTLQVRAQIANADRTLLPGMFGAVSVAVGAPVAYITLPNAAIAYNAYGSTVFVVEKTSEDGKAGQAVRQVFVQTGETRGDQVQIVKGLTPGQIVVVAGQLKLRNGTPVTIDNDVLPSNDPNPTPVEE